MEGGDLIGQVAARIVGGTGGLSLARKCVCKERRLDIISMTIQVAISRRASRYKTCANEPPGCYCRRRWEETGVLLSTMRRWNIDGEYHLGVQIKLCYNVALA